MLSRADEYRRRAMAAKQRAREARSRNVQEGVRAERRTLARARPSNRTTGEARLRPSVQAASRTGVDVQVDRAPGADASFALLSSARRANCS